MEIHSKETKTYKVSRRYCDICEKLYDKFHSTIQVLTSEGEYGDSDSFAEFHICDLCLRSKVFPLLLETYPTAKFYDAINNDGTRDLDGWGYHTLRFTKVDRPKLPKETVEE